MAGNTAEEAVIRHEKVEEEYSDVREYLLHSFEGGFEIVNLEKVSAQEIEDWRHSEDHEVEYISPRDLSHALSSLVSDSEGIF